VFAFALGLVITGQLGILAANNIGDKRIDAVDACLAAAALANDLKEQLATSPTPTLTPSATPTPGTTATPTPTVTALPTVTTTPGGPVLSPTPVCPARSSGSTFTTVLGIAFYAGVAGVAFVLSQVIARRVAGWSYSRRR
jgi:hypothetical protein